MAFCGLRLFFPTNQSTSSSSSTTSPMPATTALILPTAAGVADIRKQPTVLMVGACCLDRLLTVDSFPSPDCKIRTTHYDEVGGGNAANTATAMARLAHAKCFQVASRDKQYRCSLRIKLLTKLGDDAIATTLMSHLHAADVDTSCIIQTPNTTTSLTTIIVDSQQHTRTCMHTPGTCGELTVDDVQQLMEQQLILDDDSIIHVHCDGRHTDAAKYLVEQARLRQPDMPVSVDVEKDRHSRALDWLLGNSTTVFTNSHQMHDYLERLEEQYQKAQPHKSPRKTWPAVNQAVNISDSELPHFLKALEPSAFLTRWFPMQGKQVIITKGDRGAIMVRCQQIVTEDVPENLGPTNDVLIAYHADEDYVDVLQDTTDTNCFSNPQNRSSRLLCTNYLMWSVGVVKDAQVVDTTGAGDAFIAGYLMSCLTGRPTLDATKSNLQMGAWVAGRKLAGAGAQSALPTASDLDHTLGQTEAEVEESLKRDISPFRFID